MEAKKLTHEALRIDVSEEPLDSLDGYADIPIAFTVARLFDRSMVEHDVDAPIVKDYDAIESPRSWVDRVDVSNWGVFAARTDNRRVGGALVAIRTLGVDMLEDRDDLAVLWDIRVHPEMRGRGIGSALLDAVERWTLAHGCACLKVETQNINVPACRFYARNGFTLRNVNANAYPLFPEEIQLLWYKDLR